MTITDALHDPQLFGRLPIFRDLATWARWLVFLKALFALPMSEAELRVYQHHTGREMPPAVSPSEAVLSRWQAFIITRESRKCAIRGSRHRHHPAAQNAGNAQIAAETSDPAHLERAAV